MGGKCLLSVCCFVLFGACSGGSSDSGKNQAEQKHIFSGQQKALEDAKKVEKTLQKGEEKRSGDIDKQAQ